ncbi:creatininase family protein [Streptomyces sp. NPDC000348]|uniref:creatininase family protein n=1 Tax=Streptomyces sp. NPDC000348 TaxID=3364538 RepID=UPI003684BA1C
MRFSELCRKAAGAADVPVVVAPSVWCGLAEHHMPFGGTVTLPLPTLHALLRDVCRSILRSGFRHILIGNGHGGDVTALNALVNELTVELDAPITVTSHFTAGREVIADTLETQQYLMHACEGETSMALAAFPGHGRTERVAQVVGPESSCRPRVPRPSIVPSLPHHHAPAPRLTPAPPPRHRASACSTAVPEPSPISSTRASGPDPHRAERCVGRAGPHTALR